MEIIVNATGTASAIPERVAISLSIRSTRPTLNGAREIQNGYLYQISELISKRGLKLESLSFPYSREISERVNTESGKTKWVVGAYCYQQTALVYIDNYESEKVESLLVELSKFEECSVMSEFCLSERQLESLSEEALESSYRLAVSKANKILALRVTGTHVSSNSVSLVLKSVQMECQDFYKGANSGSDFELSKGYATAEDVQYQVSAISGPITVASSVNYVFEVAEVR